MSQEARFYLYRIVVALIPILVTFGYVTETIGNHVLTLALAVLGLGAAIPAQAKSNPKNVTVVEIGED